MLWYLNTCCIIIALFKLIALTGWQAAVGCLAILLILAPAVTIIVIVLLKLWCIKKNKRSIAPKNSKLLSRGMQLFLHTIY
jgi:cellulose synthase/poly-beta-1,6-N-acetylglucosamine synthase-like glycosyltransferase